MEELFKLSRNEEGELVLTVLKEMNEKDVVAELAEEHDRTCGNGFCSCRLKTTEPGVEIRVQNITQSTHPKGYMKDNRDNKFKKLRYRTGNGGYSYYFVDIADTAKPQDSYKLWRVDKIPDFKLA